jgi:hypothetical protein
MKRSCNPAEAALLAAKDTERSNETLGESKLFQIWTEAGLQRLKFNQKLFKDSSQWELPEKTVVSHACGQRLAHPLLIARIVCAVSREPIWVTPNWTDRQVRPSVPTDLTRTIQAYPKGFLFRVRLKLKGVQPS